MCLRAYVLAWLDVCSTNELIQTQSHSAISGASSTLWWFTSVRRSLQTQPLSVLTLLQTSDWSCLIWLHESVLDSQREFERQTRGVFSTRDSEGGSIRCLFTTIKTTGVHSLGISYVYSKTSYASLPAPDSRLSPLQSPCPLSPWLQRLIQPDATKLSRSAVC